MGDHAYKIASHVRGLWNSHMVRAGLETARDMFMWPSDRPTPIESDRSYTYYIYISNSNVRIEYYISKFRIKTCITAIIELLRASTE